MASRTVGSPQIRNRGTVGGNLGLGLPGRRRPSPAAGRDTVVEAESVRGTRHIPIREFYTGVKRSALAPDELIAAVRIPVADGPAAVLEGRRAQRDGHRGVLVRDRAAPRARAGWAPASARPPRRRARRPRAEEFLAAELAERGLWDSRGPLAESAVRRFGDLVARAAAPIDDVRGTAAYRRHSLAVMARRTLAWAWRSYREEQRRCA